MGSVKNETDQRKINGSCKIQIHFCQEINYESSVSTKCDYYMLKPPAGLLKMFIYIDYCTKVEMLLILTMFYLFFIYLFFILHRCRGHCICGVLAAISCSKTNVLLCH